jgi:hypothetical protein
MSNQIPSHDTFTVVLNQVVGGGSPVLKDAKCTYSYIWNFKKNMGLAHLQAINGTPVDITLHPLGIKGILGFMSDIPPTPVMIDGKQVVLYRVILDIYLSDGVKAAAIMFNEDGSCIETTNTWRTNDSSGLAR